MPATGLRRKSVADIATHPASCPMASATRHGGSHARSGGAPNWPRARFPGSISRMRSTKQKAMSTHLSLALGLGAASGKPEKRPEDDEPDANGPADLRAPLVDPEKQFDLAAGEGESN